MEEVLVRIGLDVVVGRDTEMLMLAVVVLEKALVGWVVKGGKIRVANEDEEDGVETGLKPDE